MNNHNPSTNLTYPTSKITVNSVSIFFQFNFNTHAGFSSPSPEASTQWCHLPIVSDLPPTGTKLYN